MFCALLMSRYQVSVYRTNGPLVLCICSIVNICKYLRAAREISFVLIVTPS